MFILETDGKPIAITDAEEAQAREIFESDEFKQDLTAMISGGTPLWDGQASLTIRPASEHEVATCDVPGFEVDDDGDNEDGGDGVFLTFLVPVDPDDGDLSVVPAELQSRRRID